MEYGYARCDFCFREAITLVRAGRRRLIQVILRRPASSAMVCNDHIAEGIAHVR